MPTPAVNATVPALSVPHGFVARPGDWSGVNGQLALLSQVHGAEVVRVSAGAGPDRTVAEADAAFTTEPGVVLVVRTADCVPVLVQGPGVVAVAHAGWRGTAADIAGKLVQRLEDLGVQPGALVAAIGPAISGTAYEVGDEVVDALRASGLPDGAFLVPGFDRPHVDLPSAVATQLRRSGVERTFIVRRCTFSDPTLPSYRRDGARAGRLAGFVARGT